MLLISLTILEPFQGHGFDYEYKNEGIFGKNLYITLSMYV